MGYRFFSEGWPGMRLEYKYTIPQALSDELLAQLANFLNAVTGIEASRESYAVKSLYFDDPQFSCYWDKKNGQNRRQKIRIRQYQNSGIMFFETKHSEGVRRWKIREPSNLESFAQFLNHWSGRATQVLHYPDFFASALRLGIRPVAWVAYQRQTLNYQSLIRISLDRGVRAGPYITMQDIDPIEMTEIFENRVSPLTVLEIKMPRELPYITIIEKQLERFRISNSKYCLAMDSIYKRAV